MPHALPNYPGQVSPKSVLVFGGSGTIGRRICREFAAHQWRVGIQYYTNPQRAKQIAQEVGQSADRVAVFGADVREFHQVHEAVLACHAVMQRLDAIVWAVGSSLDRTILRTDPVGWHDVLTRNLTGAFYLLKSAGPILQAQRDGAVILLGSLASLQGTTGQGAYAASKAGLVGLMKTVAREWGPFNVRVNAVFPGWHRSPLTEKTFSHRNLAGDHVLGRTSSVDEVAQGVVCLAQMRDVSGQIWNMDSRIW